MKHFLKLTLVAALSLLCLTACGKGGKNVEVDVEALASALQSEDCNQRYSYPGCSRDVLFHLFVESDQMEAGAAYLSSGATACEVAVIQSKDASQTKEVEKLFENRVTNQSNLYASYAPEEVTRLDAAIIKSAGSYTVLCVCDDTDKAEEILKEYGF